MIEILSISVNEFEGVVTRHTDFIISDGQAAYLWSAGGLPPDGDVQTLLEAREAELWAAARVAGRAVDLYEIPLKRVLKAVALVVMDELNILRQRASLPPRTAGQIDDAVRAKMRELAG